ELDLDRDHAIAAPVRGTRDLALAIGRFDLREAAVEIAAARNHGALVRRPRADLAAARARREVRIRFLFGRLHHRALDLHLAFERGPEEAERHARVLGDLRAFAAVVVRVEDEAVLVEAFEQNDARHDD